MDSTFGHLGPSLLFLEVRVDQEYSILISDVIDADSGRHVLLIMQYAFWSHLQDCLVVARRPIVLRVFYESTVELECDVAATVGALDEGARKVVVLAPAIAIPHVKLVSIYPVIFY